jgi:hypothetical protein
MKTKAPVSLKKQPIIVRDLNSKKNPKGGAPFPHIVNGGGSSQTQKQYILGVNLTF